MSNSVIANSFNIHECEKVELVMGGQMLVKGYLGYLANKV